MSPNVRWLLGKKPRPVQMEALHKSYPKRGWGHILDMGLGKTSTTLNEFCMAAEDGGINRMLVVSPNKFKPDWEIEATNFSFPHEFITFESDSRNVIKHKIRNSAGKVLGMAVNYEALTYPATTELIKEFMYSNRTYMAIDESIMAKNPNSGFYKNTQAIANRSEMVRILSGKPISQGNQDLWSQLKLIGGLQGVNFFSFRNRYCVMGGFKNKQVVGKKNENELNEYLANWCFIANANDYRDWPEPSYYARQVPLTEVQVEAYNRMEKDFMLYLGNGSISSAAMIITRLTKLQQITSGFIYDDDGNVQRLVPPSENPRVKEIKEILDNEIQGKLIVAAQHNAAIEILLEGLADYNPVSIRGDKYTDRETVIKNKNTFNRDNSCRVIVGQIAATKYGHTLLGNQDMPCHHNVFFENSFSLDARSQFERRNDRNGQIYGVENIDFISSPMDVRVVAALQRKEDVASAVLGYAREKGVLAGVRI